MAWKLQRTTVSFLFQKLSLVHMAFFRMLLVLGEDMAGSKQYSNQINLDFNPYSAIYWIMDT